MPSVVAWLVAWTPLVAWTTLARLVRSDAGLRRMVGALSATRTIPRATLVEPAAPSHLFWLGPAHAEAQAAVSAFMGGNA